MKAHLNMQYTFIRSSLLAVATVAALGNLLPDRASLAQSTAVDADIPMQFMSDAGTIRAVTLYPGRAAVTRSMTQELKQGLWTVRVPNLPASVQSTSLQARIMPAAGSKAKSPAKLLGVEYSQTAKLAFSSSPEGIALAEKVKDLGKKIEYLSQEKALLEQQRKLIDQIGIRATATASTDGATQALDLAAAAQQLKFVRSERERLLAVSTEQEVRKEKLDLELKVATEQLNSLGGADRIDRTALVLIAAPESTMVDIEVTYLVTNANWSPAYAIRAAGDRSSVSVEYDALVVQQSGEDWKDIKLALSTAQPTRASSPPPVEPWFVDVVQPVPATPESLSMRAMADMPPGAPMAAAAPDSAGEPSAGGNAEMRKQLEELSSAAAVQENGTAVSFELPRLVSIPSDSSKRQRTRIGAFEPKTAFTFVAAPLLTESVFLRGDMTNSSAFQLLPGRAQVFMGGDFVGDSSIPSVAPKDEFRIFFGPDRALSAKREIVSKNNGTSGLFGNSTVTTWNNRIILDNGTGREVKLELYDRRPVSRNEKIEVRVSQITPLLSTDKRYEADRMTQGILRWDLTVPATARGANSMSVSWTVEMIRGNDVQTTPVPD